MKEDKKRVDCMLLAGGKRGALAEKEGVKSKALIKIGEREMIRYVLEVLISVKQVDRIVVVGDIEALSFLMGFYDIEVIQEKNSIMENILEGYCFLETKESPLLVCTADIPLLTKEAVEDFLRKCEPYDRDVYYPIVVKEDSEKRFPGVDRTCVKTKDGTFTGGNIFLVNPGKVAKIAELGNNFIEARKNPLKIAKLLGFKMILRFLTKSIALESVAERVNKRFGIYGKFIISGYPEIAFDVDKGEDMFLARGILRDMINKGGIKSD